MEKKTGGLGGLVIKLILILIAFGFVLSSIVGSGFLTGGNPSLAPDVQIQIGQELLTDGSMNRVVQDYLISNDQKQLTQNQLQMIQNNLIEQMVLAQAYNQFGGVLPEKDSVAYLVTQLPMFQKDGKYDNELYRQYLETRHYTPDQYVNERIMPEIKADVIMNGLLSSNFIVPSDVDFLSTLMAQKRTIKTATLDLDKVISDQDVKIDLEQVKAFYDTHLDAFKQAPEYKLNYVTLNFNDMKQIVSESSISEEAIKTYYNDHLAQFTTPTRYNLHIIVVPDQAAADKVTQALKAGQAFDTVAKIESTNPDLLDMGWFTEQEMQDNLPQYVALKNVDQYIEAPQENGNIYIVQLHAFEPEKVAKYAEVEKIIRTHLWDEAVLDAYRDKVEQLEKLSPEQYGSLKSLVQASDLPLTIEQTGWNTSDETIFKQPEIAQALQDGTLVTDNGSTNKLSPIIYTNQGAFVYVIQVVDYKPARTLAFDEVQKEIESKLIVQQKQVLFAKKVQEMTTELNEKGSIAGLTFDKEDVVSRQSNQPNANIVQLAYQLEFKKDKPTFGVVFTTPTQATFVELVSLQNEPLTDSELQALKTQLSFVYQQKTMELLYQAVLNKTPALTGQPQRQ